MTKMRATNPSLRRAGVASILAGAILAVIGIAVPSASADHVDPVDFVGNDNPTCAQVNAAYVNEYKLDETPANTPEGDPIEISAADSGVEGGATLTISNVEVVEGVFEFDWSSSIPWDAVIVKQGDGATVYTYVPEVTSDTDLHPSLTNGESTDDISHVTFCRDNVTPTTTESTTTTTEATTTTQATTSTAAVLGTVVTPTTQPATQVLGAQILPATGTSTTGVLATMGAALVLAGGIALLVGGRKARIG